MELRNATVLVTGGSSGIGLSIAKILVDAGARVAITGRDETRLAQAARTLNALPIRADVSDEADVLRTYQEVLRTFGHLDVLINNAGIQNRTRFADAAHDWERTRQEIAINLDAPLHLSALFIPHLLAQQHPAIINVTSGLAFVPIASSPIYCATKAALHSFTLSLRHQLSGTPIQVVEIVPPAVNTDLGGAGLHTFGVPVDEFADAAMAGLRKGELEITYGFSAQASHASRDELGAMFSRMNEVSRKSET